MRRALLACIGFGLPALIAPTLLHVQARVVYNPSDSVARGWYRIDPKAKPDSLHVGGIVLARLPDSVAAFAAQRGCLPHGVPILKRIGAVAPQSVCVRSQVVRIDQDAVATTRLHYGAYLPLPAWAQYRPLAEDELLLLSNTNPASFDSRYFGPIDASTVLGVARPLRTWGAR